MAFHQFFVQPDQDVTIAPMVAPIRKTVTVRSDGVIEIRSSGLRPGSRAEVVVFGTVDSKQREANAFFANFSLDELAARQHMGAPIAFEKMLGGWPEKERGDGFERTVARWRGSGATREKRNRRR